MDREGRRDIVVGRKNINVEKKTVGGEGRAGKGGRLRGGVEVLTAEQKLPCAGREKSKSVGQKVGFDMSRKIGSKQGGCPYKGVRCPTKQSKKN